MQEEKIRETNEGLFVPEGTNDVLTAALGTPEHPGRTRAYSTEYTRRKDVFGKQKRARKPAHAGCYTEERVQMMRDEFEEKLQKQREETQAELAAMRQYVMSLCTPGSFTQLLVGAQDHHQGTSSSSAPAPPGTPGDANEVI